MVAAPSSLLQSSSQVQREAAEGVVLALLASEEEPGSPQHPKVREAEGEGESQPGPPQRDKSQIPKFNLGVSLQQRDQLRVLSMLEVNGVSLDSIVYLLRSDSRLFALIRVF